MTEIYITPDGTASSIYSDAFPLDGGKINRASHVEPDDCGKWVADLSPVNGPKLGPFELRSTALAAEIEWLRDHPQNWIQGV